MATLNYNGEVVESTISELNSVVNEFSSLSDGMKSATNKIVSAKGFYEYIGGISSDSFSSLVSECENVVSDFIKSVRQKQIAILAYNHDESEIKSFIGGLSRSEFDSLDLSELEDYISLDVKAKNILTGVGATAATFGLGLAEGVGDFFETGADLITLGGSLFASIFTGGYDLLTGSDTTKKMWEETKAKVSEKKVESVFNSFYENNPIGKNIKENAYLFDGARGIGKGLGYSAGIIGTSILTGGLASGLGIGSAGTVGAGNLAATAGVMGFSNGTEEAWADGASIGKGLLYGAASGAWEGTQWALGAKINQYGGLGDKVASGLFKGAASGVGTRIAMDTVDSAAEGFVQPALKMIYKDYGADNIFDNYANAFKSSGGWSNVLMQGVMGGIGSAVGEFSGARKMLKSADDADVDARKLFESSGEEMDARSREMLALIGTDDARARELFASSGDSLDASSREMFDLAGTGDGDLRLSELLDDVYEVASRQGSTYKTFNGLPVRSRNGKHPFNSSDIKSSDASKFRFTSDGVFLPKDGVNIDIRDYDKMISAAEAEKIIYANRLNLSSATYERLTKANNLFASAGLQTSINELKLIANYSYGNVGRLNDLLSRYGVSDNIRDDFAKRLSKEVFYSNISDAAAYNTRANSYLIDVYRKARGCETWQSLDSILSSLDKDKRLMAMADMASRKSSIEKFFGKGYINDSTVDQLVKCDGLPSSIRKILSQDTNIPKEMVETLSDSAACKLFLTDFMLNKSALASFANGDYSNAYKYMRVGKDNIFEGYAQLFKIATETDSKLANNVYYGFYDTLVNDYGLSGPDASKKAMELFNSVLYDSGYTDRFLTQSSTNSRRDFLRDFDTSIFQGLSNKKDIKTVGTDSMRKYIVDGHYDLDALKRDFQNFASISCSSATGDSLRANKIFFEAYFDAINDPNNPNVGEVYKVMAKLLEMNNAGKGVKISCDGVSGSFCRSLKGEMNLGLPTINGKNYETVFHESGHYFFGGELGEQLPSDYLTMRNNAIRKLQSTAGREQIEILTDNIEQIDRYVRASVNNSFDRMATQKGYDGASGFRDALIQKYTKLIETPGAAKSRLEDVYKNGSSYSFDNSNIERMVNLNNPVACADYHIYLMKSKIKDHIIRTDFDDYSTISGMLDSLTQGDVLISYGHGAEYFNRSLSYKDVLSYHELIADYTKLKITGNNHTIQYLRKLFGDDLVDQLDATYNAMLK